MRLIMDDPSFDVWFLKFKDGTANCNINGQLLFEFSIENAEIMENFP